MSYFKRVTTTALVAVTSIVGFGGLTNPAIAVTATGHAGQYGTVAHNGGAEVFCTKRVGATTATLDTYLTVYPTKYTNVGPGQLVDQTAYARSWEEWWDGQKWVVASSFMTKNPGGWATANVLASYGSYSSKRLYTGTETVTSPYYERVGFEVYWKDNSTGQWVAHKFYYASANEYKVNLTVVNTAYCLI